MAENVWQGRTDGVARGEIGDIGLVTLEEPVRVKTIRYMADINRLEILGVDGRMVGVCEPFVVPMRKTPRPGCVACQGLGVIHFQVPGELRTERRECQCWRLA